MNLKFLRIIAFVTIFPLNVNSQTIFSFSGLNWEDHVDQVDAKLTAAGYGLRSHFDKLVCKFKGNCVLFYDGQVAIGAWFESDKLVEVTIFSSPNTYFDRAKKLKLRYGQSSQVPLDTLPKSITGAPDTLALRWIASNGETISLDSDGLIRYVSGVKNRTGESRENSVKF